MGAHHFCTVRQAEELAHAAYLLGRREEAEQRRKLMLAFDERLKAIESRLGMAAEPHENGVEWSEPAPASARQELPPGKIILAESPAISSLQFPAISAD